MGEKLNIFVTIIMFAMFLGMIPAVFGLTGNFFLVEFFVICVLLIFGTMILMEILNGRNLWTAMFVFFVLSAVNTLAVYFSTLNLSSLIIPFAAVIIGLYVSALSIRKEDDSEIEPYYEEPEEKPAEKKKKKAKKTSKKKTKKKSKK